MNLPRFLVPSARFSVAKRGQMDYNSTAKLTNAGQFRRGEMVSCVDSDGKEVARGLANYGAGEAKAIAGCSSNSIIGILGYISDEEMIHRDNMVIV